MSQAQRQPSPPAQPSGSGPGSQHQAAAHGLPADMQQHGQWLTVVRALPNSKYAHNYSPLQQHSRLSSQPTVWVPNILLHPTRFKTAIRLTPSHRASAHHNIPSLGRLRPWCSRLSLQIKHLLGRFRLPSSSVIRLPCLLQQVSRSLRRHSGRSQGSILSLLHTIRPQTGPVHTVVQIRRATTRWSITLELGREGGAESDAVLRIRYPPCQQCRRFWLQMWLAAVPWSPHRRRAILFCFSCRM